MSDVNTIIFGPVVRSRLFTAGQNIYVPEGALDPPAPSDRALLSLFDWEMLDLSGVSVGAMAQTALRRAAKEELRLLLMATPPEGCVVLPPTYYCESPLCRDLIASHRYAVEQGYIRLVTDYVDLDEYFERKVERYSKAAHFEHYDAAYFKPDYPPLSELPFQTSNKQQSVGASALGLWGGALESGKISASSADLAELRLRTFDTERPSFLWENVQEHLEKIGISPGSIGAKQLRALKNRCYLMAYFLDGIAVPRGSSLISDQVVPAAVSNQYNIRAWRQIFVMAGVLDAMRDLPIERLLKVKLRVEVAVVIAFIREQLQSNQPSDWIIGALQERGALEPFKSAFTKR